MSRWIGEAAAIAALSLTVAGVGGFVGLRIVPPETGPALPAPGAASAGCREAPLLPDGGSGVGGQARICLGDAGVGVTVAAEHLTVGNGYAVWLTYRDRDRPLADETSGRNDPGHPSGNAESIDGGVARASQASFTAELPRLRPAARSEIVVRLFTLQPSAAASVLPEAPGDRRVSLVALATFDLETARPLPPR
jgi:hypothetical protein